VSNTHPEPMRPASAPAAPARTPSAGVLPIPIREAPRRGGGIRRITLLPGADARSYEFAVANVLPFVERALGPEVVADRATLRGTRIELHDWRLARRRLRLVAGRAQRFAPGGATLIMDVRACFASIEPGRVETALRRLGADEQEIRRITDQLRSFVDRGVEGLPVGPAASTVLANAVLHEVDLALQAIGLLHVRWVDDLMVFAPDAAAAERAGAQVRRTLERIGLTANERKTRILSNRSEAAQPLDPGLSPSACARRVP
jgi:hypothetical protein